MLLTALGSLFLAARGALAVGGVTPSNIEDMIESAVQLRTHSIFAPYVDQDLQNRWFSFGGDAYVNTNKHVRLTQDRPSETGWLWSRLPLTTHNYRIDVEFKISSETTHLYGDGLALWLTTRRALSGPVFGFENNFEGVGIFVDTFANAPHAYAFPRISLQVGDGNTEYNVGDDGGKTELAGCFANILNPTIATKLRITVVKDNFIDVKVQYKAWDEWTQCFTYHNPKIPASPFLGMSALTGDVSAAHDIVSVASSSLILKSFIAGLNTPEGSTPRNRIKGTGPKSEKGFFSSLFGLILKVIFAAAVLAIGVVGYKAYTARSGAATSGSYGHGRSRSLMPWEYGNKRF